MCICICNICIVHMYGCIDVCDELFGFYLIHCGDLTRHYFVWPWSFDSEKWSPDLLFAISGTLNSTTALHGYDCGIL